MLIVYFFFVYLFVVVLLFVCVALNEQIHKFTGLASFDDCSNCSNYSSSLLVSSGASSHRDIAKRAKRFVSLDAN